MADQEQLVILEQGVEVWNLWRREHSDLKIDLSEANLVGAYLVNADLYQANLRRTTFYEANLNLANFFGADLREADLGGADLGGADFAETFLINADLENAQLIGTNLYSSHMHGANLNGALVSGTIFGDIDLRSVKGLGTVVHHGPSVIGIDTIYRSNGTIPEAFLRGVGVPENLITYMRSLVSQPLEYYTCFISYSTIDQTFVGKLHDDLQSNGVRCWFAPEDMKIGDKIRSRIDESIRNYDKLLLVLSEHSIASDWVEFEVEAALAKETKGKPTVLFPIRVDNTVMNSTTAWAAHIRNTRHLGDFTCWENDGHYQKALTRLLRDLKPEFQWSFH